MELMKESYYGTQVNNLGVFCVMGNLLMTIIINKYIVR